MMNIYRARRTDANTKVHESMEIVLTANSMSSAIEVLELNGIDCIVKDNKFSEEQVDVHYVYYEGEHGQDTVYKGTFRIKKLGATDIPTEGIVSKAPYIELIK